MLSLKRAAILALAAAGLTVAQPALTTIQDTLYRADGSRFTGTVYITWNSFQAGDTSNVATSSLTLPVVNGALKTQLVPTTTASPGAQYNVRYNARGINQFTEVWAVPPSSLPLRVRDVRISTGTVVGPAAVTTPIQIGDVVGLQNELAVRPMRGVGFGIGRAAIINQAGQVDAASGSLGDCVRVDGSAGPCGSGSGGAVPGFATGEVPAGTVNGSNLAFTLAFAPLPASSLNLYRNGLLMKQGTDYQVSGKNLTFFVASVPQTGDLLLADYRYADPNNPLSSMSPPQVVCSSAGVTTSAIVSTRLGTCTIPAGVLTSGDRIEVQFQYGHTGSSAGFTADVRFGNSTVGLRSAGASETVLVGRMGFGIQSGSQVWDTATWGGTLGLANAAGSAAENISQAVTLDFRGLMTSSTSDVLRLHNFTVVRYPAQSNP
jgi:hypothetical protein